MKEFIPRDDCLFELLCKKSIITILTFQTGFIYFKNFKFQRTTADSITVPPMW